MSRILTNADGPFPGDYDSWRENRDPRYPELDAGQDAYHEELVQHHEREKTWISAPNESSRHEGWHGALSEGGTLSQEVSLAGPPPPSESDCPRCHADLDEDGFCPMCGEDFAGTQSRDAA